MEVAGPSEVSLPVYQTAVSQIPRDGYVHIHCYVNQMSQMQMIVIFMFFTWSSYIGDADVLE